MHTNLPNLLSVAVVEELEAKVRSFPSSTSHTALPYIVFFFLSVLCLL